MQFKIFIYGDTLCPWCYVGKRSLDRAIETHLKSHPGSEFDVEFKPFLVYPKLVRGIPKRITYEHPARGSEATFARLRDIGAPLGIKFDFGGVASPSQYSHRLLALARQRGTAAQIRLLDAIFSAYFEQGQDISDPAVLASLAATAGETALTGLSPEQVEAWLEEGEYAGKGENGEEPSGDGFPGPLKMGGVPSITVQGQYLVGGYQEPAVFLHLFERIEGTDSEAGGGMTE